MQRLNEYPPGAQRRLYRCFIKQFDPRIALWFLPALAAREGGSEAAQRAFHALVGQRIGALVARIAVMAPDPTPVNGMGTRYQ